MRPPSSPKKVKFKSFCSESEDFGWNSTITVGRSSGVRVTQVSRQLSLHEEGGTAL